MQPGARTNSYSPWPWKAGCFFGLEGEACKNCKSGTWTDALGGETNLMLDSDHATSATQAVRCAKTHRAVSTQSKLTTSIRSQVSITSHVAFRGE